MTYAEECNKYQWKLLAVKEAEHETLQELHRVRARKVELEIEYEKYQRAYLDPNGPIGTLLKSMNPEGRASFLRMLRSGEIG